MNQARKVTENYHSKIKVQFCHVRAHDIRVAFDKFLFRRVQPPFDIFRKDSTKLPSEALQPMCTVVPGAQKPLWQYQFLLDWVKVSTNLRHKSPCSPNQTFLNHTNLKQRHLTTLASQLTALFRWVFFKRVQFPGAPKFQASLYQEMRRIHTCRPRGIACCGVCFDDGWGLHCNFHQLASFGHLDSLPAFSCTKAPYSNLESNDQEVIIGGSPAHHIGECMWEYMETFYV